MGASIGVVAIAPLPIHDGPSRSRTRQIERFSDRVVAVIDIGTDASPWGLGGWLSVNGTITQYFASPITADDEAKYGHQIGDNKGQ